MTLTGFEIDAGLGVVCRTTETPNSDTTTTLNNMTITSNGYSCVQVGTVSGPGYAVINGGVYIEEGNGNAIKNLDGTLTIESGNFSSGSYSTVYADIGTTTQINGGEFISSSDSALYNEGNTTVAGGTFSTNACADCFSKTKSIYAILSEDGDFKITSSEQIVTVKSTNGGILVRGGSATIDDCDVTISEPECSDNHITTFYALYVAGHGKTSDVTVNDGKFTSYNNSAAHLGNSNPNDTGSTPMKATVKINGGDFGCSDTSFTGPAVAFDSDKSIIDATIAGGTFQTEIDESHVSNGLSLIKTDEGYVVAKAITIALQIEQNSYVYEIPYGGTLPSEAIPKKDGYFYRAPGDMTMEQLAEQVFTESLSISIYVNLSAPTVTILPTDQVEIPYGGSQTISIAVDHPLIGTEGFTIGYEWRRNGGSSIPNSNSTSITVSEGGNYSVIVKLKDAENHELYIEYHGPTIIIGSAPSITVTFDDGTTQTTKEFQEGTKLLENMLPIPSKNGYDFIKWVENGKDAIGHVVTEPVTFTAIWSLTKPTVDVSFSGDLYEDGVVVVTVTATHPLDEQGLTYTYLMHSAQEDAEQDSNVFYIRSEGEYIFGALAVYGDDTSIGRYSGSVVVDLVVPETPDQPYVPGDDDDYVPLPPTTVSKGSSSNEDETVKVVACAAAAVAAVIIALFLIATYRKN